MEGSLVVIGGVLLVISIGGGVKMKTPLGNPPGAIPQGDRAAAGVVGSLLIGLATMIYRDASWTAIWIVLGALGLFMALYAGFIWEPRKKSS